MKIALDPKQVDSLKKACIQLQYQVQIHETDDMEIVHAYIMNGSYDLTQTQAFWLAVWYSAELSMQTLQAAL